MRVLLTGASGFIGRHLLAGLLEAGHEVRACARNPARWRPMVPAVEWVPCDYARDHGPDDWRPRLEGIDVVINAVGIIRETAGQRFADLHVRAPVALFRACAEAGVRRVVQISALGADAEAASAYHLSKRQADQALLALDLDAFVLQPSVVLGADGGSTRLFSALARLPLVPLPCGGQQCLQPVLVEDLVDSVLALLARWPRQSPRMLPVVGGERLSLRALLQALRIWQGLPPARMLSFPRRLMHALARVNGTLGLGPLDRDALAMLERGSVGDPAPLSMATGIRPRPLRASLQRRPASEAQRWQAGLLLLRPLLRFAIGFVWLWTALVSAFLYPVEQSYALLAAVGITGAAAPAALYGAALLDAALGLATWAGYRLLWVGLAQVLLMLGYTAVISLWLPALWLHPFGPVSKNLPLLVATLIMMVLERR